MKITKRFLVGCMCVLLLLLCGCNQEFYTHKGNAVDSCYAIDVSVEKKAWKVDESKTVPIQIGVGHDYYAYTIENTKATLTVYAPGCTVNGAADEWCIEYQDFFQDKYSVEYKEELFCTVYIPKYRETIKMTFPEEDCTGTVNLVLTVTYYVPSTDRTKTEKLEKAFYYAKNDSKVVFYESQSDM